MLRLIIDGKDARLPEDSEVVFKWQNNLVEERKDGATYPFKLPVAGNKHIFGAIERMHMQHFNTRYEASIYFGPYQVLQGEAILTDISQDEIELYVTENNRSFWIKAGDVNCRDLDLGRIQFSNESEAASAMRSSLTTLKSWITCPLYDPGLKDDGSGSERIYEGVINCYKDGDFKFIRDKKKCLFAFFPRLFSTLETIFDTLGYTASFGEFFTSQDFQKVIIVSRVHLVYSPWTVSFHWFLPDITVCELLEEVERKFGFTFVVNEAKKTVAATRFQEMKGEEFYEINDDIVKSVLDDDESPTGYEFKDDDTSDEMLQYPDYQEWITGTGERKSITCISSPVGYTETPPDSVGAAHVAAVNTGEWHDYWDLRNTHKDEFRLAVYYGLKEHNGDGKAVPLMGGNTVPSGESFDLRWTGSLRKLHEDRVKFLIERETIQELNLVPNLSKLKDIPGQMKRYAIVRGCRYIVSEREIKLGIREIIYDKLKGYPI